MGHGIGGRSLKREDEKPCSLGLRGSRVEGLGFRGSYGSLRFTAWGFCVAPRVIGFGV